MGFANWIPIKHDTPDKPEIWRIADELGIDPDAVFGKLIRIWIWFDTHTTDGNAPGVTKALLDREVGVAGFCKAVEKAGWLYEEDGNLVMSHFDYHTGKSTKKRLVTARRVVKHRAAIRNAASVAKALPEEQEQEEVKKELPTVVPKKKVTKRFKPPTVEEVRAYCAERENTVDPETFVDYYVARGWVLTNKQVMKDWKAAVRTWEKNRGNGSGQAQIGGGDRPKSARQHSTDVNAYLRDELKKEMGGS